MRNHLLSQFMTICMISHSLSSLRLLENTERTGKVQRILLNVSLYTDTVGGGEKTKFCYYLFFFQKK